MFDTNRSTFKYALKPTFIPLNVYASKDVC